MFDTFLERFGSVFDRTFVVTSWLPALVATVLALGIAVTIVGDAGLGSWFEDRDGAIQPAISGGIVLALLTLITASALALQALSPVLLKIYSGRFPRIFRIIEETGRWFERRQYDRVQEVMEHAYDQSNLPRSKDIETAQYLLFTRFPGDPDDLMATSLGNVLAAAEQYSYQMYSCEAAVWMPRLLEKAGDKGSKVESGRVAVSGLVNISTACAVLAVVGGAAVFIDNSRWWLSGLVIGSLALAFLIFYEAAVVQALSYGDQVRNLFDFHRHLVIDAMKRKAPKDLAEERALWKSMARRHFLGEAEDNVVYSKASDSETSKADPPKTCVSLIHCCPEHSAPPPHGWSCCHAETWD